MSTPDDVQHDDCLEKFNNDLSGKNDSVSPSSWEQVAGPADDTKQDVPVQFDRKEVAYYSSYGDNVVQGQAVVKSRSGEAHYCSAEESEAASLIPISRYLSARAKLIYGNDVRGLPLRPINLAPGDPLYLDMMRNTQCDEHGRFLSKMCPTESTWWWELSLGPCKKRADGVEVGEPLMQRVRVAGGQVQRSS